MSMLRSAESLDKAAVNAAERAAAKAAVRAAAEVMKTADAEAAERADDKERALATVESSLGALSAIGEISDRLRQQLSL